MVDYSCHGKLLLF